MAEIEAFFWEIHQAGVTPLIAGGRHSITNPIFGRSRPRASLSAWYILILTLTDRMFGKDINLIMELPFVGLLNFGA